MAHQTANLVEIQSAENKSNVISVNKGQTNMTAYKSKKDRQREEVLIVSLLV
jgi:hypothetical protein